MKTEQGLKPIEEIQVGDQVQTRNEETGELGYHPVEELFQRETDETYHVKVNGTTIITTAEHPFWVAGQGWVEARDLKKGDKLVDLDDQEVPIEDIDVKKERITVYNFRVQGIHNYFVTDLKIWTHNCGGRDGALSGGRMSSSVSAPRVGGGGGYSRPANVSRGPAGAKIDILLPKELHNFYKANFDKALKSKGVVNTTQSPVLKGSPYHPEAVDARIKPPYKANIAHDKKSPKYNPKKDVEPSDAAEVYQSAARGDMKTWYGVGHDGKIYRFFDDNAGGVHFSGFMKSGDVPKPVRQQLGIRY